MRCARAARCRSVAFAHYEPSVLYEHTYDTAKPARAAGLKKVRVNAGGINQRPLDELLPRVDVVKILRPGSSAATARRCWGTA